MPEWLNQAILTDTPIAPETIAIRLLAALVCGVAVALFYRVSHGRESGASRTLFTTLVLLSVLIAMVLMVIGESVARAFGLVGALSIVRFRTVVDDTRDTAFVIFAVIVGMATGTGMFLVPVIGIPMVGAAAVALSRGGGRGGSDLNGRSTAYTLVVRLGLGRDPAATLGGVLARHTVSHRLIETTTARQGAALDLTYIVELRSDESQAAMVMELNQIEGVQEVELRRT